MNLMILVFSIGHHVVCVFRISGYEAAQSEYCCRNLKMRIFALIVLRSGIGSMNAVEMSFQAFWRPSPRQFAPSNRRTVTESHRPIAGSKFDLSADFESGLATCLPT
jgi:hypothetical protein